MRIRSSDLLIAALGALLAHEVAYGVLDLAAAPDHRHLPALAAAVLPIGAVLIARMALRPFAARLASTAHRTGLQVGLFFLLELVEHPGGVAELASSPAVLLGLALQPVVAWLIGASVRHTRAVVSHTVECDQCTALHVAEVIAAPQTHHPSHSLRLLPHRRGPPSPVMT